MRICKKYVVYFYTHLYINKKLLTSVIKLSTKQTVEYVLYKILYKRDQEKIKVFNKMLKSLCSKINSIVNL